MKFLGSTWDISASASAAPQGRVQFADANGNATHDSNLVWDNATKTLHVSGLRSSPTEFARNSATSGLNLYGGLGGVGPHSRFSLYGGEHGGNPGIAHVDATHFRVRSITGAEWARFVDGKLGVGDNSPDYNLSVKGTFGFTPGSTVQPVDNGDVTFAFPSNTQVRVSGKGTDGTVRYAALPLSNSVLATRDTAEALLNKTLETPLLNTPVFGDISPASFARLGRSGGNLQWHDGTAVRLLVTDVNTVTLENKTLSLSTNVINGMAVNSFAYTDASGQLSPGTQKAIPAGAVVGTTDAQTLTNKTLETPGLNTPSIGNTSPTVGAQLGRSGGNLQWHDGVAVRLLITDVNTITMTNKTLTAPVVTDIKMRNVVAPVTTTSGTLALSNEGRRIETSNAAATTITVPPNSSVAFPIGAQVDLLQVGAGQVTVVAGAGVTINGTPGLKLRAQWSAATLIKRDTDTWVLVGDLTA